MCSIFGTTYQYHFHQHAPVLSWTIKKMLEYLSILFVIPISRKYKTRVWISIKAWNLRWGLKLNTKLNALKWSNTSKFGEAESLFRLWPTKAKCLTFVNGQLNFILIRWLKQINRFYRPLSHIKQLFITGRTIY